MQAFAIIAFLAVVGIGFVDCYAENYTISEDAKWVVRGMFQPTFHLIVLSTKDGSLVADLQANSTKLVLRGDNKILKKSLPEIDWNEGHKVGIQGNGVNHFKFFFDHWTVGEVPIPAGNKVEDYYQIQLSGFTKMYYGVEN
uniref:Farnesoic acid O-methyl transferase domain-containing protein n=1 Tax=Panagrellus redivivus TaxID=6233 RepID=A0A7E4VUX9_PANRE